MDEQTTQAGETVYVAEDEGERGSKGVFLATYRSSDRETRYGWFCSNCETMDNAMDTMGRIKCNDCGNTRKPEEWDAATE